jgi:hypothetical protein
MESVFQVTPLSIVAQQQQLILLLLPPPPRLQLVLTLTTRSIFGFIYDAETRSKDANATPRQWVAKIRLPMAFFVYRAAATVGALWLLPA